MGVCIDKLPHSCGTKKGLQVFADSETGKVDGFCFSCNTRVAHPYGKEKTIEDVELPKPKTDSEIQAEIAEVSNYPFVDIPTRKLRKKYLEAFGTRVGLNEEDGKTPYALYHPMYSEGKLLGYYIKTLSKPSHQWSIGDVKNAEPYGWNEAKKSGAYKLIIVEGREDAIAVESIFDRYGDEKYKPAVIALSNGTNSVNRCLSKIAHEASRIFKEIVICFDKDRSGEEATEKAMAIFPQALTASLPEKDANECIIKGAQKAAHKALAFNASRPKNTRVVIADKELHEAARIPTPYGELSWPWPGMNKRLRRLRTGETIYIGAGVKMGKSEILNNLVAHLIKEEDVPVLVCKPEEGNKETYKRVAGKVVGRVFTDPDVEFDYAAYDDAKAILENKLMMIDLYQHVGWETLKQDIVYAAGLGAKAVFIDPITNLTNGMSASEANEQLQSIAQDLASMALDLDIVVFIFVHLKANDGIITKDVRAKRYAKGEYINLGNCDHEYGGDVRSSQFAGSRAMMRSCHLMLALEGNKDAELPEEVRHSRWLKILEDRQFNNSDSVKLFFNSNTGVYKEV